MPQKRLDETLIGVVEDCVNSVGVDLNTASPSLLSRVSGLSQATAKNIVRFRDENGAFRSRPQLKRSQARAEGYEAVVPGSSGYWRRICPGPYVGHPESYEAAKKLLDSCGYSLGDVIKGNLAELPNRIRETGEEKISKLCNIGIPHCAISHRNSETGPRPRDRANAAHTEDRRYGNRDLKPAWYSRAPCARYRLRCFRGYRRPSGALSTSPRYATGSSDIRPRSSRSAI